MANIIGFVDANRAEKETACQARQLKKPWPEAGCRATEDEKEEDVMQGTT